MQRNKRGHTVYSSCLATGGLSSIRYTCRLIDLGRPQDIASGLDVFDISDGHHHKELRYYSASQQSSVADAIHFLIKIRQSSRYINMVLFLWLALVLFLWLDNGWLYNIKVTLLALCELDGNPHASVVINHNNLWPLLITWFNCNPGMNK